MALSLATLARNNSGAAITALIDVGSAHPSGFLQLFTGLKPGSPQVMANGVPLAILHFAHPAFGEFANGVAIANPIIGDTDIASTGVPGWFRIYNRDGDAILDGNVTISGGGGDLEFDDLNFVQGGTVLIDSLTIAMPQSIG